ncbi:glycosyltransferase 61 family protein [Azospirillum sp. B506]|uniref:glycosyltransferase 61 family protein n=1 Tax=Azospirillum sp. B506 TaxID=137721 RepID=UPI00034AB222|nr:glycosyltransferase 61 family protein [Azospirillum sp. B506]
MDVNPDVKNVLFTGYIAAARSGDYERAKRIMKIFAALEPNSEKYYIHISGVCSEQGEFAEAIRLLERSEILNPNDRSLYMVLARCYEAVGKTDLAKEIIRKELEKNQNSFIFHQILLSISIKDNDVESSVEITKKLLENPEVDEKKFIENANILISLLGISLAIEKFNILSVKSADWKVKNTLETYKSFLTAGVNSPEIIKVCSIRDMEKEGLCHLLPLSQHRRLLHSHDAYVGVSSQSVMVKNRLCRDLCYHIESDASSDIVNLPNTRFGTGKEANVIEVDEAIFVGGGKNYYHWMMDYLPGLGILERDGILRKVPVIFSAELTPFQTQSLEHIGFDFSRYLDPGQDKVFRCSQLWATTRIPGRRTFMGVPDWWQSVVDPETLSWLRNAFLGKPGGGGGQGKRKLYLSRGGASIRRLLNDADVVELMMAAGYEIVHPETLSVVEQVSLFADASHVVGVHGAAFTNIAFMASGAKVLEIVGEFKPPEFYRKISGILGLSHDFIEARIEKIHKKAFFLDPRFGDISVDIPQLKNKLADFDDSFRQ